MFVSKSSVDDPVIDGSFKSTVKKSAAAPGLIRPPSNPILAAPLTVAQSNNRSASIGASTFRSIFCKRK
jgi:hypothetical protein